VSFSSNGSLFGAALTDGEYKLWDVGTLQEIDTSVNTDSSFVYLFSQSNDQMLVAESNVEETYIWDLFAGELLYTLPSHWTGEEIALSNDGKIIVTLSPDNRNILLSDLSNDGVTEIIYGDWRPVDPYADYPVPLYVFFSPHDSLLVAMLSDRRTMIWDLATKTQIEKFDDKSAITFSPDGKVLAMRLEDGSIALYDTATWSEVKSFNSNFSKYPLGAIFSHDSRVLIGIDDDKTVNIWNCDTGTKLRMLETVTSNLILSPDGTLLVTYVPSGGEINLWGIP
jgi:WD40 repeat protein